ncbi:MAG: ZIP family metal transporter [Halobacteriales archaeon]
MTRYRLAAVPPAALAALSVVGYALGVTPKVLGIAWVAFLAMALAVPVGVRASRRRHARRLVWGYGLASGAMVTSAAVFLVPGAVGHHPEFGGFGLALGVLAGYSAHTVGHRLTHVDAPFEDTALRLSAHALAAGAIIGVVYAAMPSLGPLLGWAIVSHKAPAGYAAASRLAGRGRPVWPLLVPAAGVGLTAIPTALLAVPSAPVVNALVFGFAAGIFLHVAMDFLPRCEVGGEIYQAASLDAPADHGRLDRLRLHAVSSTVIGGAAVFLAWLAM